MKTVLCAVNSAYIHKNLAVLKIEKYVKNVTVREYSVNQPLNSVYLSLLSDKADVYCFSCYIWNVEFEKKLAQMLKKAANAVIVFGGPEAGGDAKGFSSENPFVDYVIKGEGEIATKHLLSCIEKGEKPSLSGIYSRGVGEGTAPTLQDGPMPYSSADLAELKNRIVYYEASRGCYNGCAYCVSSGERYIDYDIEKVKREILFLCENGVRLVKFVDRSFNACKSRAERLFRFLSEETGDTRFHCEIAPDLMTDEMLDIIKNAPFGKFQFEAGIQSLNTDTLLAVTRRANNEKAFSVLKKIIAEKKFEVHADIIAGLPLEDMESFIKTFNGVYSLSPYMFSVGFLKVLKGTKMRELADKYGISYADFPPYEVIKTDCLNAFELAEIKKAESAVDKLYNSHAFCNTLSFITPLYKNAFLMYRELGEIIYEGMSKGDIFSALLEKFPKAKDSLVSDFMLSAEKTAPHGFSPIVSAGFKERCMDFIEQHTDECFPELSGKNKNEIYKKLKFFEFDTGMYASGREIKRVYKISCQ